MIALADHDLVRLCRDPRYAERFPRSPAERRSRARKIGITLGRPVNATPLVTVWRLIAEAGLAPVRAPARRPEEARSPSLRDARLSKALRSARQSVRARRDMPEVGTTLDDAAGPGRLRTLMRTAASRADVLAVAHPLRHDG